MGRLTGPRIAREVDAGGIVLEPFLPENVGPNSVDLRLSDKLAWYRMDEPLDAAREPEVIRAKIPPEGFVLSPGKLYLGLTMEVAGSSRFIPGIEGRSSVARLGIQVHMTAGFGDIGFVNRWTLEMTAVHPVRVYAGMRICQVYFDEPVGDVRHYAGKYKERSTQPVASRLWRDFDGR